MGGVMQPKVIHSNKVNEKKKNKMDRLVEYLQGVEDQNFTGYIRINFSQGSVGRIEKFEEILKK